jgi:O-antigen/teichoic acid export membrane protein
MSLKFGIQVPSADATNLTDGRLLARNTLLSIVAEGAPLALGLIAIPILVRALGVDRYGVLTLSYIVVSYLSLFDLGLGRAAAQKISDSIGSCELDKIPPIFWTSIILMFVLGIVAAAIVAATSHWLVYSVLNIPTPIRAEAVSVFLILGVALPFVLSGSCAIGTLASFQRFDLTAAVGATAGVYAFIAPLVVLLFSHRLLWIVGALVAGRLAAWAAQLTLCIRLVPGLSANISPTRTLLKPLMSFGGWITVSGITSPLMVNLDRFVIGSMLSMAAVSYYTVPYQIVSKLPLLSGAMATVLFPAFSATVRSSPARATILFERASRYAILAIFPGVLILFFFSREILTMFFGEAFAGRGCIVMRWLLIGILCSSLARIPYALIQAANRPDVTAKFHLAEAPIYFLALFLLLPKFGVAGAAVAWTLRGALDAIALFTATTMILPGTKAVVGRIASLAAIALGIVAVGALLPQLEYRIVCATLSLSIYLIIGWFRVLDSTERSMVLRRLASTGIKGLVFGQA